MRILRGRPNAHGVTIAAVRVLSKAAVTVADHVPAAGGRARAVDLVDLVATNGAMIAVDLDLALEVLTKTAVDPAAVVAIADRSPVADISRTVAKNSADPAHPKNRARLW